mmetsp:Transcript_46438/g.153930  ORF Transcript_46438/g.153930 Transcript_46438/m.153930 type:complete len:274 (+) Transcript_46438:145-966(+)
MRALQPPVADGFELARGGSLAGLFAAGELPARPLLIGTNRDDISLFLGFTPAEALPELFGLPMVNELMLRESVRRFFPATSRANRTAVLERYPLSRYPPGDRYRRALFDLSTDGYFACPSRRVARVAAARLPGRAFRYVFSADLSDGAFAPGLSGWLRRFLDREVRPWLGAYHGANEVVFWHADDRAARLSPDERALGRRMVEHWVSFVKSGAPLPSWPGMGDRDEPFLELRLEGDRPGRGWHADECTLLEQFRFVWNPLTLSHRPFLEPVAS